MGLIALQYRNDFGFFRI